MNVGSCQLGVSLDQNSDVIVKKGFSAVVRAVDVSNLTLCVIYVLINLFVVIIYVRIPSSRRNRTCNITIFNHVIISFVVVIYKACNVVFWYDTFLTRDKRLLHQVLFISERYVMLLNVGSFLICSLDRFLYLHSVRFNLPKPTKKQIIISIIFLWTVCFIPLCIQIPCINHCNERTDLIFYLMEITAAIVCIALSFVFLLISYYTISKNLRLTRDFEVMMENRREMEIFKVLFTIITYFCLSYFPIPVYKTVYPVDESFLQFKLLRTYKRRFTVVTSALDCKTTNLNFGLWDVVCTFFFTSTPIFNSIVITCRKDDYTEELYRILSKRENTETISVGNTELTTNQIVS